MSFRFCISEKQILNPSLLIYLFSRRKLQQTHMMIAQLMIWARTRYQTGACSQKLSMRKCWKQKYVNTMYASHGYNVRRITSCYQAFQNTWKSAFKQTDSKRLPVTASYRVTMKFRKVFFLAKSHLRSTIWTVTLVFVAFSILTCGFSFSFTKHQFSVSLLELALIVTITQSAGISNFSMPLVFSVS